MTISVIPRAPLHSMDRLASFELRDYRKALETALTIAPVGSTERTIIRNRLLAVVGEQAERAGHPEPPSGTWDDAS